MNEFENIFNNTLYLKNSCSNFNPFVLAYLKGDFKYIFKNYSINCTVEEFIMYCKTCQIHGDKEKILDAIYKYDFQKNGIPDGLIKYLFLCFLEPCKTHLLRDKIIEMNISEPIINIMIGEDYFILSQNKKADFYFKKSNDIAQINYWNINNEIMKDDVDLSVDKIIKYIDSTINDGFLYSSYRTIITLMRVLLKLEKYSLINELYNKYLVLAIQFSEIKVLTANFIYFQASYFFSVNDKKCLSLINEVIKTGYLENEVNELKRIFIKKQNKTKIKKPVNPAIKESESLL